MKKALLVLALIFGFNGTAKANDLWEHYRVISGNTRAGLKALEAAAPESLTITSADALIEEYKKVGEVAQQLGKTESYVWTLNNAMYASIVLFKKLVNYDATTAKINSLSPKSKERKALVKALQAEYAKNLSILERHDYNEIVRIAQDANVGEKQWNRIVSNRAFITYVVGFVEDKF
jgi:hypothetical protein